MIKLKHLFDEEERKEIMSKKDIIVLAHYMENKRYEVIETGDVSFYPEVIKYKYRAGE